jgi:hypothetical protein
VETLWGTSLMAESLADSQSHPSPVNGAPNANSKAWAMPRLRVGAAEIATLCIYAGLLAWAIPHHEPWADEAQAWQIARTLPLLQMFHVLSYEAHPALWYICLWVLTRLHLSYAGMHWVAAAIGFSGVAVLVIASPFPRFIKLLLPFTFYLAFQYAIVARSYVLAPLLIFLCAYFWPRKFEKPLTIALCLGLLANVAAHAAAISGGFAVVYLIDLWLGRHEQCPRAPAKRLYAAAVMLLVFYAISIWTALPAKDAGGAVLVVRPDAAQSKPIEEQDSELPPSYPRAEPANRRSIQWLAWKVEWRLSDALTVGLIQPFWLGCLFWVLLAWKFFRTRKLHYLLPAFFLVVLSHVYAWFWHAGLMLPCVIALLWMTWPRQTSQFRKLPLYEQLPALMLLLIAAVQIGWAEFAFAFDHAHDYASGAATASFLRPYAMSHARILAIGNDSLAVDIQPYFDHNVFLNEPYSYYWWSTRNPSKLLYKKFLTEGPEIVVLEWRFRDFPGSETIAEIPLAQQLTSLGYRNTHTFCGGVVRPGRAIQEWECDLIYQPERPR